MKRILSFVLIASFTYTNAATTTSASNKKLVKSFCYAMQSSNQCKNINMRLDTEQEVEKIVGSPVRGPQSQYNSDCLDGTTAAIKDGDKACDKAIANYGCSGKKIQGLIQDNPFNNKNGSFCKFNGL